MISQRELVERARRGDHDAFSQLATTEVIPMFRLARLILGSTEAAEDATQEALVAAWRGLPRLRDAERFDAWMRRLLVRSCYRQRRARPPVASTAVDAAIDARDDIGLVADRDQIERGFRHLPADQRAALVLRYHLDLPLAEVAAAMHVPQGTAKSRIHRGLSALRAALEADARIAERIPEGSIQ